MAPKTLVIDLDGTIIPAPLYNPKVRLPWFFFFLYIPIVSLVRPNKAIVKYLQDIMEQGGIVVIATARPVQFTNFTEKRLKKRRIPSTKLFCVGNGKDANERKLDIIKANQAELIVDNSKKARKFFRGKGVVAVNVAELLTPS